MFGYSQWMKFEMSPYKNGKCSNFCSSEKRKLWAKRVSEIDPIQTFRIKKVTNFKCECFLAFAILRAVKTLLNWP